MYVQRGIIKLCLLGVFEYLRDTLCSCLYDKLCFNEKPLLIYQHTDNNKCLIKACPSLVEYIEYHPGINAPHSQTLVSNWKYLPGNKQIYSKWRKEYLKTPDNAQHAIATLSSIQPEKTKVVLFCAHGMGGCLKTQYITNLAKLCISQNWQLAVHIRRGHDDTELYDGAPPTHSSYDDMKQAVDVIKQRYNNAVMIAIGFSAGGNVVAYYQGRMGSLSPFKAAMTISAAGCDYETGTKNLTNLANEVLVSFMLVSHGKKPNLVPVKDPPTSLYEFDAALYGHDNVDTYYQDNSGYRLFNGIKQPFMCIAAMDDPIIPGSCNQRNIDAVATNENMIVAQTQRGGHIGWHTKHHTQWWLNVIKEYVQFFVTNV